MYGNRKPAVKVAPPLDCASAPVVARESGGAERARSHVNPLFGVIRIP